MADNMDSQYYVQKSSGEREGPFPEQTIRQMVDSGQIVAGDKIEDSGTGSVWEPSAFMTPPNLGEPVQATKKKSNPIVWILVALAVILVPCIGILAAILFPVFAQARQAALFTSTLRDFNKLGAAVSVYKADFDDTFPPVMDTLAGSWRYIGTYYKAPMPSSKNPAGPDIAGNGSLANQVSTKLAAPTRTLMFFDSEKWSTDRRVAALADGSAKRIEEREFQDALTNGLVLK